MPDSGGIAANAVHRDTLIWLLICQLLVLLPFVDSHPLWLAGLLLACLGWRAYALRRGDLKIHSAIKLLVVVTGLTTLYLSGYRHLDIDTMVAIVLLGFVLKSIETWSPRDTLMLIFTGYFLSAAHFVYSQTPWQALYTVIAVTALSACAISVHSSLQTSTKKALIGPLKIAASMMLLSAPLAVLLFLIVPRIPPLWTIPQQSQSVTGLSDEITPGDISSLVRSGKDAFRIRFFGATPDRENWYWRALVYQHFDGKTWTVGQALPVALIPRVLKNRSNYRYQVIMEPSGQHWIPVLDAPTVFAADKARYNQVRTLSAKVAINSVSAYVISSNSRIPAPYRAWVQELRQALQLPRSGSEKLRQWARDMRARADSESGFVESVLKHIRENDFYYTLNPPRLLTSSSLDEFWFNSRQGFCSHYAGAFVFIMRSAGIPSRLVGGYLGGRYNPEQQYITVRQMDAHAWAEVWLRGRGWVRVDPTAAVAPERVLQDLSAVFEGVPEFIALLAGRTSAFVSLRKLQLWMDQFEYRWQLWVVQFDEEARISLFDKLLGDNNLLGRIAWLLAAFAAVAVLWALLLGRSQAVARKRPAIVYFKKLEKQLGKNNLYRKPGETVADFLERAENALPQRRSRFKSIARLFYSLEYSQVGPADRTRSTRQLRHLVSRKA